MSVLPRLECVLICPHCGVAAVETMPTDSCLYFYECLDLSHLATAKAR